MSLPAIAAGSTLLIDTNILIYARRGDSEQCRELLRRCAARELKGYVTTIALAEFCHRRMMMEAQSQGLSSSNPSKALGRDPKLVQSLTHYRQEIADLLSGELGLINVEAVDFVKALELQKAHGLLTNDSLQVAASLRVGVTNLATADGFLSAVPDIKVFMPEDL